MTSFLMWQMDHIFANFASVFSFKGNVRRPSQAHWKVRSGLTLVIIEQFSLGVTVDALQANENRRFLCTNGVSLAQNFRKKKSPPPTIFLIGKQG